MRLHFAKSEIDTTFFLALRHSVNNYFSENEIEKTGNKKAFIKGAILLISYTIVYASFFATTDFELYVFLNMILGFLTIFVALNIAHDAAHNTYSSKKHINDMFLYVFDFLGASGYMWRLKHVHSHHPHVNIPNLDGDIKQSNLVRIFPYAPFLKMHKYQYIYMPVLYLFYTLVWLCFRDFRDYYNTQISGKPNIMHKKREYIKLIIGKSIFILRMIILPYLFLPYHLGYILLAFLMFHFAASATVAMALISAHIGEDSVYPTPNENGEMDISWVKHQIITTSDFATDNRVLSHLFGGFNHHVMHHLFPNICHIHYPPLTNILKKTCIEYGMPYKSTPSLYQAMLSHFRFLKLRSKQEIAVEYLEM